MTVAARLSRAVALLLFSWQAIIVQAHLHVRPAAASASMSVAAVSSPAPQRPDSPSECPVCREVAHAGQYLSPGPVLVTPPATVAQWRALPTLSIVLRNERSHAWRSRAPPMLHLI